MFVKNLTVFVFVMTIIQTGCTIPRSSSIVSDCTSNCLPPRYQNYYEYPQLEIFGKIVNKEASTRYTKTTIEIPLSFPDDLEPVLTEDIVRSSEGLEESDPQKIDDLELLYLNRIEFYLPKGLTEDERRPGILISPILGGTMIVDRFAKYYAKHGFVVAIVHRKEIFWTRNQGIGQIEDYLRMSTIRIRQALDWMISQPSVDKDRLGAFGISYGAIMHSILAAVDSRIKYHILAMPAAPLSDVIVACPDPAIKDLLPIAMEEYNDTLDGVSKRLQNTILTDPILLKNGANTDRMFFYITLFDRVVGTRRSINLWKAFGKPRLKVLPFGHYGGILVLPLLQYQTRKIFEQEL